jgi:hypothetical protein
MQECLFCFLTSVQFLRKSTEAFLHKISIDFFLSEYIRYNHEIHICIYIFKNITAKNLLWLEAWFFLDAGMPDDEG